MCPCGLGAHPDHEHGNERGKCDAPNRLQRRRGHSGIVLWRRPAQAPCLQNCMDPDPHAGSPRRESSNDKDRITTLVGAGPADPGATSTATAVRHTRKR